METPDRSNRPLRRPQLGLHWTTWTVLTGVVASLVYLQFGEMSLLFHHHGWPLTYSRRNAKFGGTWVSPNVEWELAHFDGPALELDVGIAIVLASATVVALEGWLRRERRWQLRLGDLIALVFTASVMAGEYFGALNAYELAYHLNITPSSNFPEAPWWIKVPVYLSVACLVLVTGRAIVWLVHQLLIGAMIVDPPVIE